MQKKFHPMEGECYASVWGIMHFRQYLYCNHFTFRIDHKPLEWLTMASDAYGKKGRWINTLQDFSFKIIHKARSKQTNVDALSTNFVDIVEPNEDLVDEIKITKCCNTFEKQGRLYGQVGIVLKWVCCCSSWEVKAC